MILRREPHQRIDRLFMVPQFEVKRLIVPDRTDRVQRGQDVSFFNMSLTQFAIDRCQSMLMLDDDQLPVLLKGTGKKDFTGLYRPHRFSRFRLQLRYRWKSKAAVVCQNTACQNSGSPRPRPGQGSVPFKALNAAAMRGVSVRVDRV